MVGKGDKGKQILDTSKPKKKRVPPPYRRPTGIHISEGRSDDIPARPSHSRSSHHSYSAPTHVGPLHGSSETQHAAIAMPPPSQYYQTIDGTYTQLPSPVLPSATTQPGTHSGSTGSIGLTDLRLRDTTPSTSGTPTTAHSGAPAPYLGQRDASRREYIIPYGKGYDFNI